MPYALQLYTLRDLLTTPQDIVATFHEVRKAGYEWVQVSGVRGAKGAELRQMLDDTGLRCCATHCSWDEVSQSPDAAAEEAVTLGASHTALAWIGAEHRTPEGYRKVGEAMAKAAQVIGASGVSLSYHNHAFEFERYEGRTGLEWIFVAAEGVGMEFDTYWLAHAGCDPAAWIREFIAPQPLVHLKDRIVRNDQPIMAEVGYGNLNWRAIFEATQAKGCEWLIIEQDACERPPVESSRLSLAWLKENGPDA